MVRCTPIRCCCTDSKGPAEDSSSDESALMILKGRRRRRRRKEEEEAHENNTTVQEMKDGSHITRNDGVQGFIQNSRRDDTSSDQFERKRHGWKIVHFPDLDEVIPNPSYRPLGPTHTIDTLLFHHTATGFDTATCVQRI